jgi:hypothetical protein
MRRIRMRRTPCSTPTVSTNHPTDIARVCLFKRCSQLSDRLATDLSLRRVACLFREVSGPALPIAGAEEPDRQHEDNDKNERQRGESL